MNVDTLIGWLVGTLNRHIMNLPESSEGVQLPAPGADRSYLLYLHIPYCTVLCPFCSFHRVQFRPGSAMKYYDCLQREIELVSDAGYTFDELYVGGGTPTVLAGELVHTLQRLKDKHPLREISVETNPDHLGNDAILELKDAGVNRLSVGVQSFDDDLLREMQRHDKYGNGLQITQRLQQVAGQFDTLNVDMIFNFPHQTEDSLDRDLDMLINTVGADQVSYYPLMSSGSTEPTMERRMGRIDRTRERDLYRRIAERLLAAGYTRNSAWCFSRKPGMFDEYIVNREEYLGLGSGAFSYLQGSLFASTFSISEYRRLVTQGKTATVRRRAMSAHDQMRYYLLMRLFGGALDLKEAECRFDNAFQRSLWRELGALRTIGAIRRSDDEIVLTERGHYLWVVLMREFFSGINRLREQLKHSHIQAAS
jgi:coproporphyrinogen III oxidase-like Fe-S oxidoreductase